MNALMSEPTLTRGNFQIPTDPRKRRGYQPTDLGTTSLTGGPVAPGMMQGGDAVMAAQQTVAEPNYDFRATPGYEFRRDQGAQAVQNSLTGRGLALSGRAAKELERYGQDYGAGEYQNVFNRRASIAGVAQPMQQQMNQAGMNFGANVGNALMQGGANQASAYMNQGASMNNAIQGGLQNYMFYNALGGG